MKSTLILLLLLSRSILSLKNGLDLSKYKWAKTDVKYSRYGIGGKGSIQGGAYYNGRFYQFHDRVGGIRVIDVKTHQQVGELMKLSCDPELHWGSVMFSNEFSYVKDGKETKTTLPLAYCTGHYGNHEVVDVVDIEHDVLVRKYLFPNRKNDVIAAFDFEKKHCWIIGYYPDSEGAITPYFINEYIYKEDGSYEEVGTGVSVGVLNSTLQDCHYLDGHIYILSGWGKMGQTMHIHDYNTATKQIEYTNYSTATDEAEALAFIPENQSFIVSGSPAEEAYVWAVFPETENKFLGK